ncbi:MAG: hemerythrin domain-containing protein [Tissierellia bacterium]|nr:hemerythrin domain-containing protein [Tissierellia bacterium]
MRDRKLRELLREYPRSGNYFLRHGIDPDQYADFTLEGAFRDKQLDPEVCLTNLAGYIDHYYGRDTFPEDLEQMSVPQAIDHIKIVHHHYEKELLKDLSHKIERLMDLYFFTHGGHLKKLARYLGMIKVELEIHFIDQEKRLFPAIAFSCETGVFPERVTRSVQRVKEYQSTIGGYVNELIKVTDDFAVPEGEDEYYKMMVRELEELVRDIYLHIYKENTLVFEPYEKSANK